ncbi:sigma-70 family RNA polymerase sigma factor [Xinfangfangia sp. D13-10-4-6]|uniref:RNA polymerase sigma factor n=1 Tax=Pseudogemmobacter hezensis TaxID=2737662 RepID=UPI0015564580|nr:sigma-70 family RNA polymerase sigma factor [Pseudogemmobacter hezensis]NPD17301.1 sigma-70 family RNA polymerase sigma factor [Pseudogemmobacter hezensis]
MAWDIHGLFQRHSRGISRALRRRGLDAETAADLTQDTFVRTLAAGPDNDAADHLKQAYLYRVARNLWVNHTKREALLVSVPWDDPQAVTAQACAPDTETIVANREHLHLVTALLETLPERQRRAFLLHRIHNLPMARIAEELGISTTRTWELIRETYRLIVLRTGGL